MTPPRFLVAALVAWCAIGAPAYAQETPHYDVVAEYIREMGVTKANHDVGMKELAEGKTQRDKMMNAIRNSTRVKLALAQNIHTLQSMRLKPPFDTLLPNTVEFYKQKLELHDNMITIATAFSTDKPKPDVDYGNLAATMPQITATLEHIDQSLFQQSPMVFLLLVEEKPDAQGHMSRLSITKKQAQQLVASIDGYFGSSLNEKNQDWNTSAASVLKTGLTKKGYTFADEKKP
jgi:hypothetical protein